MEKYEILEILGDGAFGSVSKARNTQNNEIVAIKKFKNKFFSFEECKNLREVKSLMKLNNHNNLIKILEMIYKEDKTLYLVFDYMKENLYELMKANNGKCLSETQIRAIMYQILQGISYMHKYGFFHRDLKPENILVEDDLIKIADFGLAREIRSVPPYTDYVSTRWYRAPECLLKSTTYNSQVDIWALGCIMIELYNLKAIFPGNSERDVLYKICSVIGVPDSNSPNIIQLAKKIDFKFPLNITCPNLSSIIPNASLEALSVIKDMLQWDPANRPAANNLLLHPFFTKTSTDKGISNTTICNEEAFNSKFTKKFGCSLQNKPKQEDITIGIKKINIEDELRELLDDTQDFNDCKCKFY